MTKSGDTGTYHASYPDDLVAYADKEPLFSATMQEIADLFHVRRQTVCDWCSTYDTFADAVAQVREGRNDIIARKLYRAASGYTYQERKSVRDADGRLVKEEVADKYLPENVNAIRLWLINRNSRDWKAKPDEPAAAQVTINLVNNLEEFR